MKYSGTLDQTGTLTILQLWNSLASELLQQTGPYIKCMSACTEYWYTLLLHDNSKNQMQTQLVKKGNNYDLIMNTM